MQLQTVLNWLPQIAVTSIPGFIHQWLAAGELVKSLRTYPFFNPSKSPTYWLYRLFVFSLTTFLFWVVVPLIFRIDSPSLQRNWKDWNLWGMALAVGFFLPYLLNAPFSILALGVFDIGPGYDKVVGIFRKAIVQSQQDYTQKFWEAVGEELRKVAAQTRQQNYIDGHRTLRNSLVSLLDSQSRSTSKLPIPELESRLSDVIPQRLSRILPQGFRPDLSHEAIGLLHFLLAEGLISRKRLPQVLKAFGCYQCAQEYFSNQPKDRRSRS